MKTHPLDVEFNRFAQELKGLFTTFARRDTARQVGDMATIPGRCWFDQNCESHGRAP